jgi:hypothetical protein
MKTRRQHGRVRDELPVEVREQVDRLLIEPGVTYDDIKKFLDEQGHDISRSAIGRYGKDFLSIYQQIKVIEDKSKVLVSEAGDGMILEEAASKLFSQMILEAQMSGKLDIKKLPRIISDFAKLQASVVSRERLKKELTEKVKETADAVSRVARAKGLSDETAEEIRRKILGITK